MLNPIARLAVAAAVYYVGTKIIDRQFAKKQPRQLSATGRSGSLLYVAHGDIFISFTPTTGAHRAAALTQTDNGWVLVGPAISAGLGTVAGNLTITCNDPALRPVQYREAINAVLRQHRGAVLSQSLVHAMLSHKSV